MAHFVLAARQRAVVRALGDALFGHQGGPGAAQLDALVDGFEAHLRPVSRTLRFGLLAMLDLIRWLPLLLVVSARPFDALPREGRVKLLERTNARFLEPRQLESGSEAAGAAAAEFTLLAVDVSFISATLVLPPVLRAAPSLREAVVLVKPQFEAGREHVGKGGIVRDPEAHKLAVARVADCVQSLDWEVIETIPSPITGVEGNREFLLYAKRRQLRQPR